MDRAETCLRPHLYGTALVQNLYTLLAVVPKKEHDQRLLIYDWQIIGLLKPSF